MKRTGVRVYRTVDGRHVLEGHPDAAFLAYSQNREIPEGVWREIHPEPATKPVRKTTKPRRASTKEG